MPFITGNDLPLDDAAAQALEAGHTMVLFSHKLSRTQRILDRMLAGAQKDEQLRAIIEARYKDIVAFKARRASEHR
jgi:hypothetical protein